ncbi:L-2-amino-thiazoline-4-carboxylic acid hydrolase [Pseudonocardia humida]|uniref:L-2-amino-thiazoline-4-carboxylic acid hydrolase n=1 Tax=Pseudonocardia humida TaxID=2800819 RepID=A0ABT0ZWY3_9PSEU|nr:L-2-amino-thiazoline-4-carboxylic acid hydrolase [Pseudonocardia humida]MCO1655190.1 L-2-amino-thiazoline-4-carboxylic acid hydrolase [Pseudonocardia humida]
MSDPAISDPTARDHDRDSRAVVALFFDRLDHDLAAGGTPAPVRRAVVERIRAGYAELVAAPTELPDDAARSNLRYVAAVVAAHRVLREDHPADTLLDWLTSAFVEPLAGAVTAGTRAMLDAAPDPFAAMVAVARERESTDFGAEFRFAHPHDDDGRFHADVHRCGYHEHLTRLGEPGLTPVLCAFDTSWIRAIDPERHGFAFTRATTIGLGGTHCPFHFRRTGRAGERSDG